MNYSVPHFARIVSLGTLVAITALCGCSVRKLAVNKLGDALAGSGTTFAGDDDPELIRQAIPFSLKLMESLLAESPEHRELLRATSSGFTQYAYAFVQQDADELEARDFAAAESLRTRARKLYLRARNYGLRGLESAHPGFTNQLFHAPTNAVRLLKKGDVPAVYWTAASWGALIALSKDDPARVSEIPQMETLIDRAAALDADWGDGSIHSFLINYEMSRQGIPGDPALRAKHHFQRAVDLGKGRVAGPFVTYAEAVCVEKQDLKEFESLLGQALAIDPAAHPEFRLVNEVMQRRARWLLSRKEDLFLLPAASAPPPAP
jgi:predicted anti-sigma-YlaC factor YlaD